MGEPGEGMVDGFYSIDQLLFEEGLLQGGPSIDDFVEEDAPLADNLTNNKKKKDVSLEMKRMIVNKILEATKDGKLVRGTLVNLAREFGLHKSTTTRIY